MSYSERPLPDFSTSGNDDFSRAKIQTVKLDFTVLYIQDSMPEQNTPHTAQNVPWQGNG